MDYIKKPDWLKVGSFSGDNYMNVKSILDNCKVNTVCDEALCPNRGKCFNENTATFIILGNICSRHCKFCNITSGIPQNVDSNEIDSIAKAVNMLKLKYVVITSVTRDDLPDGGSKHFADTIREIKKINPNIKIEALIPDFNGDVAAINQVLDAPCVIVGHNIETVPALYSKIRPEAKYLQSINVIKHIKNYNQNIISKSGIMVGLGETYKQVINVMNDLRTVKCDILTIGQYLRPSKAHVEVVEYIHPNVFVKYKQIGLEMGFKYIESSPLTRSSYLAHNAYSSITESL